MTAAFTACSLTVGALTGCAPEPGALSTGKDTQAETPREVNPPITAEGPPLATGVLTSADGQTTGRVNVVIEEVTDDFGETDLLATVEFFDLVSPYAHLTPGGALAPRGDDPCFDTGLRSAGGTITPDKNGYATATMPAEVDGYSLHEVLLHLDWTQVGPEDEGCMQPVVARAPLVWSE